MGIIGSGGRKGDTYIGREGDGKWESLTKGRGKYGVCLADTISLKR